MPAWKQREVAATGVSCSSSQVRAHGEYFTHVVIVLGFVDKEKRLKLRVMSVSNGEETSRKNMIRNLSAMISVMVCFVLFFLLRKKVYLFKSNHGKNSVWLLLYNI